MAERLVTLLCYWNGCVKYGPDGVYYEGSTSEKIRAKRKTELSKLLDGLYLLTGLDKQRSKLDIFGKYPVAVSPNLYTYVHLPVVNDTTLETMLEVPSKHPSINTVELYLEVNSTCDDAIDPLAACSSKRQRTQPPVVKLERDKGFEVEGVDNTYKRIEGEANGSTHGDGEMAQGVNGNANKDINVPGLETAANACLNNGVGSSASNPSSLSSLWVDDHDLRVGLRFKDRDELKKAVEWCSIRGQQKCLVQETGKDECMFKCIRWKCSWSLYAATREEHGECFEITKYTGPHTCSPIAPESFNVELAAEEIESLIRVQPTLTIAELKKGWLDKFGYKHDTTEMKAAKQEAIKKVYGDWDQSFRLLPKLMVAFHSSNELAVDWQYDPFPYPEFASFRSVFCAFSQSIQGFPHCRPVIIVDTKDLNGKYPMKLMVALGLDADDCYFPLAFAVTKQVSIDSWRWFLSRIREKVTQRKGLCLISSPHPDIVAVVNEPGSLWKEPWAYHRFCLDHVRSQFRGVFKDDDLDSLVEQAGSTTRQDEFDSYMDIIKKENSEAWQWLDKMAPHQWALAHDGGRRYGYMITDVERLFSVCESIQSLGLGLPVTAAALLLFDDLRLDFQTGLSNSLGRLKRGDMYTKPVMDKLKEFTTASITYVVMPLDNNAFQVTTPLQKNGWIVRLSDYTCTCGEFQSEKIPCLHALAVCEKLKINPLQYVDDYYTIERLYKTYSASFSPIPEVSAWPEASGVPTLFPPVILPPPPQTGVSGKRKKSDTSPKSNTEKPTKEQSKSAAKEKPVKGKGKGETKKPPLSDAELKLAVINILKKMDRTASFADIIKRLGDKFKTDLNPRKSSIKQMIQDELTKVTEEAGDEDKEAE
ncbi:unnamed protein product [Microthlaspi erraticum]|uniref:SWIM-type domain-containing protein n=1 Tax=Microthlaspi erraticum TaxID=1685480 RepID=A0A6D2KL14_9BRAS|nr:unnamed protein product [Microthlaspi erraticum]